LIVVGFEQGAPNEHSHADTQLHHSRDDENDNRERECSSTGSA